MGAASLIDLAVRLRRGRERGARTGRHQSGTAPYGYVRDYSARRRGEPGVPLRVHEPEAEVVRTIFRLYLELRSIEKVIGRLRAAGVRTRRGKEWTRASVAWILKNETYAGRVLFGSIRSRGVHEAIVSPDMFARVRRLLARNNRRRRGAPAAARAAARARGAAVLIYSGA